MNLEQFYAEVGGTYEDVKKHLMSDGIIKRFLLKFPDDKSFQTLEDSLKSGAVEDAFRAAHTLKGLCLNLGFSDLYTPSAALTEILRAKKPMERTSFWKRSGKNIRLSLTEFPNLTPDKNKMKEDCFG